MYRCYRYAGGSNPLEAVAILIELQGKKLFRCEGCWQYNPRIRCICGYTPKPLEKPPKDFERYKQWDKWFLRRYMLEWVEEPEQIYEIGAESFTHEVEKAVMQKQFRRKPSIN